MSLFDVVRNHPAFAAGIGGATIGAGAVAIAGTVSRRRKKAKTTTRRKTTKTKSRKTTTKRKTCKCPKKRGKRPTAASRKRIRMTKNGQPFIILPSGKARFISKKSARIRRKRKGGTF